MYVNFPIKDQISKLQISYLYIDTSYYASLQTVNNCFISTNYGAITVENQLHFYYFRVYSKEQRVSDERQDLSLWR